LFDDVDLGDEVAAFADQEFTGLEPNLQWRPPGFGWRAKAEVTFCANSWISVSESPSL